MRREAATDSATKKKKERKKRSSSWTRRKYVTKQVQSMFKRQRGIFVNNERRKRKRDRQEE